MFLHHMVISGTKYKTRRLFCGRYITVENFMPADKFAHGNTNVAHFVWRQVHEMLAPAMLLPMLS